jgi:hypothetical protein
MLDRVAAARYCGYSVPTFISICPVRPVPMASDPSRSYHSRRRLERYDRFDLDKWIDGMKGDDARTEFDEALELLDRNEAPRNSRH